MLSFFFNDTATTEIYTLSLHDALPIYHRLRPVRDGRELPHPGGARRRRRAPRRPGQLERRPGPRGDRDGHLPGGHHPRSEEHTSELQSRSDLVCRLLLEKKKKTRQLYLKTQKNTDQLQSPTHHT